MILLLQLRDLNWKSCEDIILFCIFPEIIWQQQQRFKQFIYCDNAFAVTNKRTEKLIFKMHRFQKKMEIQHLM